MRAHARVRNVVLAEPGLSAAHHPLSGKRLGKPLKGGAPRIHPSISRAPRAEQCSAPVVPGTLPRESRRKCRALQQYGIPVTTAAYIGAAARRGKGGSVIRERRTPWRNSSPLSRPGNGSRRAQLSKSALTGFCGVGSEGGSCRFYGSLRVRFRGRARGRAELSALRGEGTPGFPRQTVDPAARLFHKSVYFFSVSHYEEIRFRYLWRRLEIREASR